MSNIKTATLDGAVLLKGAGASRQASSQAAVTETEDLLQTKERRSVRNGILWTVIPVFLLMASLMWGFSTVDEAKLTGASAVKDVSVEMVNVYKAATNAGILQTHDASPAAMTAWLAENDLSFVNVPDLGASGLVLQGARALSMPGGNWALMQYAGAQLGRADLLAVAAPKGRVGVPQEAVESDMNGVQIFTDRVHSVGVTYVDGPKVDWILVSADENEVIADTAKALIASLK